MTTALKKTEDGTFELTITLPWSEVSQTYEKIVAEAVKHVEVPGFRKGKAPKNLAEKKLDKNKLYEEVIAELIPKAYSEALTKHKINPIVQPEIKLVKARENDDWQFVARTCEKPKVKLNNYQEIVKKVKKESKVEEIWLPGKGNQKQSSSNQQQKRQKQLNVILEALLKEVNLKIPQILIEKELARRLSNLIDELKKLGLTIDKYLQSKGKTPQQLRAQYQQEIEKTYKLEFILEAIADQEKIIVQDNEINKILEGAKEEKEKKALEGQRYYLASLLRRQKTLDKLLSL